MENFIFIRSIFGYEYCSVGGFWLLSLSPIGGARSLVSGVFSLTCYIIDMKTTFARRKWQPRQLRA